MIFNTSIHNSGFKNYFRSNIDPGITSITAPIYFNSSGVNQSFANSTGLLALYANTVYYVRLYNGAPQNNGFSQASTFIIPPCSAPTPTFTPTPTPFPAPLASIEHTCVETSPYEVAISWSANNIIKIGFSTTDSFDIYWTKNVTGTHSTIAPSGFLPTGFPGFQVGTTYYARLFTDVNTTSASKPFMFNLCPTNPTPTPTPKAWMQVQGGDVHSNQ